MLPLELLYQDQLMLWLFMASIFYGIVRIVKKLMMRR